MNGNSKAIPDRLRPHFSSLLTSCRDLCVSRLSELTRTMFKDADTALVEFANKAQSNMIQSRFFEAIREVHARHAQAEQTFQQELANGFQRFAARTVATGKSSVALDRESLSLVDKDDAEETIAVQNLAQKAMAQHTEAVYSLGQRLAVVNGGSRVDDAFLPGGPHMIAKAYKAALHELELHHTVRILLYALFDKMVMKELGDLYAAMNQILIDGGVLKNLKSTVVNPTQPVTHLDSRRQPKTPAEASGASATASPGGAGGGTGSSAAGSSGKGGIDVMDGGGMEAELFNSIRELLNRKNLQSNGGEDGATSQFTPEETQAATTSLVSSIGGLQQVAVSSAHAQMTRKGAQGYQAIDKSSLDNIRAILSDERTNMYHGIDRRKIPALDQNVIELVGMMFDYMLGDENLPNAVKALLSRLHTPFLKIAIIDKHFFTQTDNPARKLLNSMAGVGMRWVSDHDLEYGLYPFMLATVERVLIDFDDDPALFGSVLEEFEAGVERHVRKVEQIEKRTLDAARGSERLDAARSAAHDLIAKSIGTRRLLADAVKFLHDTWQDKLMFIHLRCGDNAHGDCETAMQVTQKLVEALDLVCEPEQRASIRDALPSLQDELHTELRRLADYGSEDLDEIYARAIELQQEALAAPHAMHMDEAVTGASEPEPAAAHPEPSDAEQEALALLAATEFGTWFEFRSEVLDSYTRLKMAWHSSVTGNFMFVNQAGVRAAVISKHDLAKKIVSGEIRLAVDEKRPFVDRAMTVIRKWLQKVVPDAQGQSVPNPS